MTTIFEQLPLDQPYEEAKEELARMLRAQHARRTPEIVRFSLTLASAKIAKDVVLTCDSEPVDARMPWKIAWAPYQGGPFPHFSGDLSVRPDPHGRGVLVLTGSYMPPLGEFGEAFDHLVGRYIAIATCRQLLLAVAEGLSVGTMRP